MAASNVPQAFELNVFRSQQIRAIDVFANGSIQIDGPRFRPG